MTAPPKQDKNAPAPVPYAFPVGVYESIVQDYDNTISTGATIAAWTSPILCPLWNVSPTGWLRGLWFDFTLTIAGNAATPAFKEDGPWSLVQKITLYDLGSQVILQLSGYEWMVINKFGGYFEVGDPRADLSFTVTTMATTPPVVMIRSQAFTDLSISAWSMALFESGRMSTK